MMVSCASPIWVWLITTDSKKAGGKKEATYHKRLQADLIASHALRSSAQLARLVHWGRPESQLLHVPKPRQVVRYCLETLPQALRYWIKASWALAMHVIVIEPILGDLIAVS